MSGAYTAPVVAAGPDDDPPWLATVYVPGPSLAEAVHTAGPVLALRASTDRQAWRASTDGSVTSGIAAARGIVYAGGNDYVVRALRAIDGGPVWQFTASGPVASQIAVAGRTAYVGSNNFRVYALH
ncbi:MAG TPA: PQQ-binding-like beta-propeller repeat protein [Streptosporangiaceae bacterium]|nr:PQQ-binding-like beta-propeller repeat protein [Streptosporangiaceae bacterium]